MAQYKKFYVKGWDELVVKLKRHGGEMIVPMPEPEEHVQMLLEVGRLFDRTNLVLKQGSPSRCHQNASRLWAGNRQLQLVTGYALSDQDQLWQQHSWCWQPSKGRLIETTVPAIKYFGVVLNDFEALHFALENVPEYDDPKYTSPRMGKYAFEFLEQIINEEDSFLAGIMKIAVANKSIGKLKYHVSPKAESSLLGESMLEDLNKGMNEYLASEKAAETKPNGKKPCKAGTRQKMLKRSANSLASNS